MESIADYINQQTGIKKEWIQEFTEYMAQKHPEAQALIFFRIPTYKIGNSYVAFSIAKEYFAFHTNDSLCFQMLKESLDKAAFGKRSVKIKYSDEGAKVVLYNTIEYFFHIHKDDL